MTERQGPDHQSQGMSPDELANDLVIDGLLHSLGDSDEPARERRLERLSRSIRDREDEAPGPISIDRHRRTGRRTARLTRWAVALAAMVVLANALFIIGLPGGASVRAELQSSIEALRGAGDRRYEVRMTTQSGATQDAPAAVIDMRAPDLLLVRHTPPHAPGEVVIGRDELGEWAISPAGEVTRENTRRFYPPWSVARGELLVGSIDLVLEQLLSGYDLERGASAPLAPGGAALDRVLGARIDRGVGPYPDEVEVWIDPDTQLPQRIEMRYDETRERRGGPPPLARIVFDRVEIEPLGEAWFTPGQWAAP